MEKHDWEMLVGMHCHVPRIRQQSNPIPNRSTAINCYPLVVYKLHKVTYLPYHVGNLRSCLKSLFLAKAQDVVVNGVTYIRAMALDWTTGNLYVIDTSRVAIMVVNVEDPEMRKDVVRDGLLYPSSIALSPQSGCVTNQIN